MPRIAKPIFALALAFFLAAPDARADLIVNGSFENSTISPQQNVPPGSTGITGWTVILANIDYMDSASSNPFVNVWQAADGTRSLDLAGSPGLGGVQQTFLTTPGTTYTLTFSMAGNPASGPTIRTITVSAAGQFADFNFDITGKSFTNMGWVTESWDFVAVAPSTTLAFINTTTGPGGDSYGPTLDNVTVEVASAAVVPEPSSLVLALACVGLLGWTGLRRERVPSHAGQRMVVL